MSALAFLPALQRLPQQPADGLWPAGHIVRFTKQKKWLSVDGAVAAAMATNRASSGGSAGVTSLYDDPEWEKALAGFNS